MVFELLDATLSLGHRCLQLVELARLALENGHTLLQKALVEGLPLFELCPSLRNKVNLHLLASVSKHLNPGDGNDGFLVLLLIGLKLPLLKFQVGDQVALLGLLMGEPLPREELALHLEGNMLQLQGQLVTHLDQIRSDQTVVLQHWVVRLINGGRQLGAVCGDGRGSLGPGGIRDAIGGKGWLG